MGSSRSGAPPRAWAHRSRRRAGRRRQPDEARGDHRGHGRGGGRRRDGIPGPRRKQGRQGRGRHEQHVRPVDVGIGGPERLGFRCGRQPARHGDGEADHRRLEGRGEPQMGHRLRRARGLGGPVPGLGIGFEFPKEADKESRCRAPPSTSPSGAPRTTTRTAGPRTPPGRGGHQGRQRCQEQRRGRDQHPVWWVFGGYTQPDKKSLSYDKKATPFTTASGITGSVGWAQSTHTPDKGKCASDGKALTFGFKNSAADFVSFNFYGAKGVKDEVAKATIMKILGTVRLHGTPTGG